LRLIVNSSLRAPRSNYNTSLRPTRDSCFCSNRQQLPGSITLTLSP